MKNWREKMVIETKQQLYSMSLNSTKTIMSFFEEEFTTLVSPIEDEYPGTCLIEKTDEKLTFSIGKNKLELKNEVDNNSIIVSIARAGSPLKELEQWGTIYFEEGTYIKMMLPRIDKGKIMFVDKCLVDDLFYKAFAQTWLF